jgi:hypothetical protein
MTEIACVAGVRSFVSGRRNAPFDVDPETLALILQSFHPAALDPAFARARPPTMRAT